MRKLILISIIISLLAIFAPAQAQENVVVVPNVNLRVRAQPRVEAPSLAVIPRGTSVLALGRTADTSWIQVEYQGVVGWATVFYLGTNANLNNLPVTDATDLSVDPRPEERVTSPDGTAVRTGELVVYSPSSDVNVRVLPDEGASIIGRLARNERATVTLLDPSRLWGQVEFQGQRGWVALYVVAVLGDIRTVEVLGEPATSSELPVAPQDSFNEERRQIVQNAQNHLARFIPEASGLIDIFRRGTESGFIACGPVPPYMRDYRPLRTDYARVPELEAIVTKMNQGFALINRARAQWLNACTTANTLLYRDRFPIWLALANEGGALLGEVQSELAAIAIR